MRSVLNILRLVFAFIMFNIASWGIYERAWFMAVFATFSALMFLASVKE